jgi:hypothetical protein
MLGPSSNSALRFYRQDGGVRFVPWRRHITKENKMGIGMILLVILVLALAGAIPTWPHSRSWGYGPSGGVGLILMIVVVLLVLGKI